MDRKANRFYSLMRGCNYQCTGSKHYTVKGTTWPPQAPIVEFVDDWMGNPYTTGEAFCFECATEKGIDVTMMLLAE